MRLAAIGSPFPSDLGGCGRVTLLVFGVGDYHPGLPHPVYSRSRLGYGFVGVLNRPFQVALGEMQLSQLQPQVCLTWIQADRPFHISDGFNVVAGGVGALALVE